MADLRLAGRYLEGQDRIVRCGSCKEDSHGG